MSTSRLRHHGLRTVSTVLQLLLFLLQTSGSCRHSEYFCKRIFTSKYRWLKNLFSQVFIILKKKNKQLSLLHRYHHTVVLISTYIFLKYVAGGAALYLGYLNSLVHVFMYFCKFLVVYVQPVLTDFRWRLLSDGLQTWTQSVNLVEEKYHSATDRAVPDFSVLVLSDIDIESRVRVSEILPLVYDDAMHNHAAAVHRVLLQQLHQKKKAEKLKKLNVMNANRSSNV